MSDLHVIVYISTATRPMSQHDLEALLHEARRLNAEDGITGVLLYNNGTFAQCVEGAPAAVRRAYGRISRSRRHHDIVEILNEPAERRSFPDWHMGFLGSPEFRALSLPAPEWQRVGGESGPVSAHSLAMVLMNDLRQHVGV